MSKAIDLAFNFAHSFTAFTIFSLMILLSSLFSSPKPIVKMYVEGYFFWVWRTKISPVLPVYELGKYSLTKSFDVGLFSNLFITSTSQTTSLGFSTILISIIKLSFLFEFIIAFI